jgi:hypothetical protein
MAQCINWKIRLIKKQYSKKGKAANETAAQGDRRASVGRTILIAIYNDMMPN